MSEFVKIRNKSGEARFIPSLGVEVDRDEVFEAPEDLAKGLVSQSIFERVDAEKAPAKKAASKD